MRTRLRLLLLAATCVILACAPAVPAQRGPSVVRMAWTDVGVPTPFRISTAGPGGAVLLSLIYDTLTWKDDHGIIPWLATAWQISPDATDFTFTLQQGVRWQDGQPLTADDVAFSYTYYASHPYRWMPTAALVESATAQDPEHVRIRLKDPYPAFLEEVAGSVPIIPQHVWANVADPLQYAGPDASLGSGPFRLAEYRPTDGAYRLTANPDYFKGRPRVDEIQQLNVPNETLVQSVQQGQIDLAWSTDASVLDVFRDNPRLRVLPTAPLSVVRLVLNTQQTPLDQAAVRQAIAYALDRASIAQAVTHGMPVVGSAGVVPPETPWFAPNVQQYPYDPNAARALLGAQRLSLALIALPEYREPELLAPMLAAVGIDLQTQRVDAPTRVQLLNDGRFQMAELQHIGVGGDPDYLRRWYLGQEANQASQGDVLRDPKFESLAAQQSRTVDVAVRRTLIAQMQAVLADDVPTIPLYYRRFYWIYDASRLAPMNTVSGLMNGIPFVDNKLIFLRER